jgi:plastocyanin
MDRRRLVALTGAMALVLGVGSATALAADQDVAISGFTFSPRTVTVNVGDTVTWTNSDAQAHTATSGSAWNTGDIANGDSASITFRSAGTFDYICAIHPTMTGTVVVRGTSGTTPPSDTEPFATPDHEDWLTGTLAVLGIVMIVGTLVAERRFRDRQAGR